MGRTKATSGGGDEVDAGGFGQEGVEPGLWALVQTSERETCMEWPMRGHRPEEGRVASPRPEPESFSMLDVIANYTTRTRPR